MDTGAAVTSSQARVDSARGPHDGVRVLELTGTMSGPFCTLLLAQFGARVDKVEPPRGDVVRHLAPARTPIHLALNAAKGSIVLDFTDVADRELRVRSLPHYNVVVHNMRPQAAARLGLTTDGLARAGSTALLCELVGYEPGPYESRPAGSTIQAVCGAAWVQGNGGEPAYVRTAIADKTTGVCATLAICAELASRAARHRPHNIKVPTFETMVAFTAVEQPGGITYEPATDPALYPRTASPHRKRYPTQDGYLSLMLYTDRHCSTFLTRIGRGDLVVGLHCATLAGRTANIDEICALVASELRQRTTSDRVDILEDIDFPHARVQSLPELLADPHLLDTSLFRDEEHPTEGRVPSVRAPLLFDGQRPADLTLARALGRDSANCRQTQSPTPQAPGLRSELGRLQ